MNLEFISKLYDFNITSHLFLIHSNQYTIMVTVVWAVHFNNRFLPNEVPIIPISMIYQPPLNMGCLHHYLLKTKTSQCLRQHIASVLFIADIKIPSQEGWFACFNEVL